MIVIIGAGITGLLLGNKYKDNSILIEEQPDAGGVYLVNEIGGNKITLAPPVLDKIDHINLSSLGLKYRELKLYQVFEKREYLKEKICNENECDLPSWLKLFEKEKIYFVENFADIVEKLKSNLKIIRGYPIRITRNNYLITNRGNSFHFNKLINTGSLLKLLNLLGERTDDLSYISAHITVLLTKRMKYNWNVLITGSKGISFSHIFRLDNEETSILYIYSFFKGAKAPELKRTLLDLKKKKLVMPDDVLAFRTRIIKEAILLNKPKELQLPSTIVSCGRLGKWENISLAEAINESVNC
ncbi:MAG: hypothetical protein JZD40_02705 [Sulfolobus sp.]|nr:hypothetical protein [Sulfolobus sp.]